MDPAAQDLHLCGVNQWFISTVLLCRQAKSCVSCCRAPVLVALALIECGMKYEDAVQFIRQ